MTSLMDKIELLIKKEKSSPERKKNEPVKSSNEILSELFGAFNAAPPKIEEIISKKSKKAKKKHKKEKKKRSRSSSSDDSDDSDYSHKRKKRKKSKSKKRSRDSRSVSRSPSNHRSRSPKIKIDPSLLLNYNLNLKSEKSDDVKVKHERVKTESEVVKHEKVKTEPEVPKRRVSVKIEDSNMPSIDASLIPMPESPKDLDSSDLRLKLDGKKADAESEKNKGKIQIKNLKFSTVFEETVKQAEEQARRKAEKYEEGEYTDSSNESVKEIVVNSQFPKSADPGGILKKAAEDTKVSEEDKSHKKSKKESSHKSSRRERERTPKRSSSKSRRSRSRSASRRHRHTSGSRSRHRSSSRSRRRSRSRTRVYPHSRHHSPPRYRGGGRRSSRSPTGVKLADSEKKRLLEVARRNAINMLKNGEVPGGAAALPPHTRNQVMAAIQSGGKSVDELTDFCKHLSKKEALGELSSVCSEDEDMSENEDTMAFHHPFLVKEKAPIIMNIRGGAPLPVKSTALVANKDELRLQFPVSSGSQHRDKASEWVPVEPMKDLTLVKLNSKLTPQPVPAPKAIEPASPTSAGQNTTTPIQATASSDTASMHSAASALTAAACQMAAASHLDNMTIPRSAPLALPAPPAPAVDPPPYMKGFSSGSHLSTVTSLPALPAPGPQAYPPGIVPPKIDIASIVSQKLLMIRKEQEKKEGPSKGFGWSKDRHLGQFTGSTGAQILTPRELASGTQAWAKKDQLTRAAPVAGGMGMHLLQKMGWTPGRGLGKEGTGALQPLLLEVKLDTRGLQAKEEIPQRYNNKGGKSMRGRGAPRGPPAAAPAATGTGGKHPVSLLGEYCSKHKLGPPEYNLCFECGPDHKKNFLFKVRVNGVEYQPAVASQNKKQAKADAALLALQKLGLQP